MIRVLVVDDERYARREVRRMLERRAGFRVVAEASSGSEALDMIERHAPDLVFLDIQMPGMTGLEVMESVPPDSGALFVFVTAYDEHAVRAFELAAADYLLKPVREERFLESLERAEALLARRDAAPRTEVVRVLEALRAAPQPPRAARRLAVSTRQGNRVISPADVLWVAAEDYCVRLVTSDGSYVARSSMARMVGLLDPARHVRVHRSTIVNVDAVERVETAGDGKTYVCLRDGARRRVSRSGKRRLEDAIEFLG